MVRKEIGRVKKLRNEIKIGKKEYELAYWSIPTKRQAIDLARSERSGTGGAIIRKESDDKYRVYGLK